MIFGMVMHLLETEYAATTAFFCLRLFFTFYHGQSPFNPPFGEYLLVFSNRLKQLQVFLKALPKVLGKYHWLRVLS